MPGTPGPPHRAGGLFPCPGSGLQPLIGVPAFPVVRRVRGRVVSRHALSLVGLVARLGGWACHRYGANSGNGSSRTNQGRPSLGWSWAAHNAGTGSARGGDRPPSLLCTPLTSTARRVTSTPGVRSSASQRPALGMALAYSRGWREEAEWNVARARIPVTNGNGDSCAAALIRHLSKAYNDPTGRIVPDPVRQALQHDSGGFLFLLCRFSRVGREWV
jgi:hypothetical protein